MVLFSSSDLGEFYQQINIKKSVLFTVLFSSSDLGEFYQQRNKYKKVSPIHGIVLF